MLKIYFLGTSSGVPTRDRNVSGIAIMQADSKSWVLIDCGEGTQHQILHSPMSLLSLSAICITHMHGDHCYGLPGLLASAGMAGRKDPLTIFAPREVEQMMEAIIDFSDLHLPYELIFVESKEGVELTESGMKISTCRLSHRVESHAFCFDFIKSKRVLNKVKIEADEIPRGPLWGKLQNGENIRLDDGRVLEAGMYFDEQTVRQKIIIAGDNDNPELLRGMAKDADLLVHESTYSQKILERVGPAPQHSSALRVAEFAANLSIPNLVLTHFSSRYQKDSSNSENDISVLANEALSVYSGCFYLANDHDSFVLLESGILESQT